MVLEKYARKTAETKTASLSVRLEQKIYDDFIAHCNKLGLITSEAIRLLIIEELEGKKDPRTPIMHTSDTPASYKSSTNVVQVSDEHSANVLQSSDGSRATKQARGTGSNGTATSTTGHGEIKPWVIHDKLPCPICQRWKSRSNFPRHIKTHGYEGSSVALLSDPQYADVVKQMMEQLSGTLGG